MLQPGEHDLMIPRFWLHTVGKGCPGSWKWWADHGRIGTELQTTPGYPVFDRDDPVDPERRAQPVDCTDGGDGAYGMLNKYINVLNAPRSTHSVRS